MRSMALAVLVAVALAACNQQSDVTGSTGGVCPARNVSLFNARDLKQCVAACLDCDHGTRVTCSTSCTLKGAR
jgi:hypothetical protein